LASLQRAAAEHALAPDAAVRPKIVAILDASFMPFLIAIYQCGAGEAQAVEPPVKRATKIPLDLCYALRVSSATAR
jgi:hypothetical protein